MFLIYNKATDKFMITSSVDGIVFSKQDNIEIYGEGKAGIVYQKPAGVMATPISEAAILADVDASRAVLV